MKKMNRHLPALLLSVAALSLLLALSSQHRRASAAQHTLYEGVLSTLAESAEDLQQAALQLDKLLVTGSREHAVTLLHEATLSLDRVRSRLSALPAAPEELAPVLSWLAEVSEDASSCLARLAGGEEPTQRLLSPLQQARANLSLLQAEMNLSREELLQGGSAHRQLPASQISAAPDAAAQLTWKALPSAQVNAGTAMKIARDFVGESRVTSVAPAPDTTGAQPTFGVTVQTQDVQLNLEITRRGGKVLMMSPETAGFAQLRTADECHEAAIGFLHRQGYVGMTGLWQQQYDGMYVVTCVSQQQDVLVLSDRVTVQVRMDTAEVVGLEASGYLQHHTPRRLAPPLLTREEAAQALSYPASAARLCLLPVAGQERLCWMFTLTREGSRYLSFIDAITGQERLLEKVVETPEGYLAV